MSDLTKQDEPLYIAIDCFHAGTLSERGTTIHEATVQEWTYRIQKLIDSEVLKALSDVKSKAFVSMSGAKIVGISAIEDIERKYL